MYFKCPMVSAEILTKDEWKGKIKEFLYDQLEEERGLTACLIIQSCNSNRDKVRDNKYMKSIIYNHIFKKFIAKKFYSRYYTKHVKK